MKGFFLALPLACLLSQAAQEISGGGGAIFAGGPALDATIEAAIKENQIPGAVLVVGHRGKVVHRKAYGSRALVPRREPMTLDTVFDVASLTKVVATTSGIMRLVEAGKVRLSDRVTTYLPQFQAGHSDITLRQLLTHYSGMRPDVDLEPRWSGYVTGIDKALIDRPTASPDTRFTYSDINFVLLGEIVARVSGKAMPAFLRDEVFGPLGMTTTMFNPPAAMTSRIAPTEILPGTTEPLRGVVHDPTARYMGGVAGHAGLFSTAADLTAFAQMMLNGGQSISGARIFSPLTVRTFTTPQSPGEHSAVRGLGWDIDSPFSSPRGDLFPRGGFGHTGFTGTSMWMDPHTQTFVVLLTNSVHPKLRPAISSLRGRVASVAAAALPAGDWQLTLPSPATVSRNQRAGVRNGSVLTGIDVVEEAKFAPLQGFRVGLISNHTGITKDGRRTADAMVNGGVQLKALFSPEHGFAGKEDHENVGNAKDEKTGLPVWSLYAGANRRPTEEMLKGITALVFDIHDIGTRFYTYTCTMKNAMEEAAERGLPFFVLDRPNPINGIQVEGPVLDPSLPSFVGCFAIPLRHGMTAGELATMMNASAAKKADLRVIRMKGWQRTDWFDSTGLTWVNPSPNMRSLNAALLYPGIGMLEYSKNYSVGRGTEAPFEHVGADWIDGPKLAAHLNARQIPGIRVYPTVFQPESSNLAGKRIQGVRFVITDRDAFRSVQFGIELGTALARLFPGKMTFSVNEKLAGRRDVLERMERGESAEAVTRSYETDTEAFRARRAASLLY
ncbi:MAG TPA: exo-beta-N-acetylmuramidase NamZ domain-containing protein [Bryobacteraceae bacterium]|nr:exo-beta-N-acetylmuramidase NamZ domain-containing protein [Bryobacteraceae bacterium]